MANGLETKGADPALTAAAGYASDSYYYLKKGDIIKEGDEYGDWEGVNSFRGKTVWKPAPPHMVGRKASDPRYLAHTEYRRKILSHTTEAPHSMRHERS